MRICNVLVQICNLGFVINVYLCRHQPIMHIMGTITFWVCILVSPNRETAVKLTSDMRLLLDSIPDDTRLCYFRIFNDMQEALGHKLFIENISDTERRHIVKTMNPKGIDLRGIYAEKSYENQ